MLVKYLKDEKELYETYLKTELLKRIKGHVEGMTEIINAYTEVWLENMERQFGRHVRRWDDNIKIGVKVTERGVDRIHLEV
jgi:hypothetical protein